VEQARQGGVTVVEQKAVELKFNDEGIVEGVRELSVADMQEVDSIERRTPTYGNDDTFIKQLIGNLSRPTPSTSSRREGQQ
jgi:outer membrane protein assembly factor BamE (lipoprotein component of BamABCDE complex)